MGKGLSLANKAEILRKYLGGQSSFTISDMEEILQEKKSTLNWTAWNLNKQGHILRLGKGLYSFEAVPGGVRPPSIPSVLAAKTHNALLASGYEFFLSGLDILSIFMTQVPQRHPPLVFVDKYSLGDVSEYLRADNINTIDYSKVRHYPEISDFMLIGDIVLLAITREFSYSENGMASFEKAFVDLYYEVTRKKYPLPLPELVRIFNSMKRRIRLDEKRMIKIASRRSLQRDIRFILEYGSINPQAFEFVELLK